MTFHFALELVWSSARSATRGRGLLNNAAPLASRRSRRSSRRSSRRHIVVVTPHQLKRACHDVIIEVAEIERQAASVRRCDATASGKQTDAVSHALTYHAAASNPRIRSSRQRIRKRCRCCHPGSWYGRARGWFPRAGALGKVGRLPFPSAALQFARAKV
jgi:hypothetical protein